MENKNKAPSAAKGNKTRGSSRKNEKKASSRPGMGPQVLRAAPAAQVTKASQKKSGQNRILKQEWVCGTTYVGNGTLGAAGNIYFRPRGLTTNVYRPVGTNGMSSVPISGSDAYVGDVAVADTCKHFARYRVRSIKLVLETKHSATSADGVIVVAPVRGMGDPNGGVLDTTTAGGNTDGFVESMDDFLKVAIYENGTRDLTPYIAGGSGARQNEFNVAAPGFAGSLLTTANHVYWEGAFPCSFVVGGACFTATLNGSDIHNVVIKREIELLDYIGSFAAVNPLAYYAGQIEHYQALLAAYVAELSRVDSVPVAPKVHQPTCRQLFDLRSRLNAAGLEIPTYAYCASGCPSCSQREAEVGQFNDNFPKTAVTCRQRYDLRVRLASLGLPVPRSVYCPDGCVSCAQREESLKPEKSVP